MEYDSASCLGAACDIWLAAGWMGDIRLSPANPWDKIRLSGSPSAASRSIYKLRLHFGQLMKRDTPPCPDAQGTADQSLGHLLS